MKNTIRTLALLLLLAATFASCYEDKGNYKYDWVKEVVIEGLADTTVSAGARLRVEPVIYSVLTTDYNQKQVLPEFQNPDDYIYHWEAWTNAKTFRGTLGTGMVLDTTINLAISDRPYWILFKIMEKASGVIYQESFLLKVTNELASGFFLLYETPDGLAEIDVAGVTPSGEDRYISGLLEQIDYPYRGGGANFVEYEAARDHLWVGTGDGTAWLNKLTFEWKDTQMAQAHMTQGKPAGYTFKDMVFTDSFWFFITNDGEASAYSSNATVNGLICASINLLPPGVSTIDGAYQEIRIAPYFGGGGMSNALFWDETNKRMLKYPIYATSASASPVRLPDADSFHGHDLRYMATVNTVTGALLKNPAGEYLYAMYVYNSSKATYDYRPEFTRTLINNDGLLDAAKNITLSYTNTPYLYFTVGNKLYVYRDGEGCVEVITDVPLSLGEITCLHSFSAYAGRAELIIAADNPSGEGSTIYTFKIDPTESKRLSLQGKIENTPAGVIDITYLF
ncbi:MAG: hypothetical protein LBP56_03535 [Odoribacteraceae bacterium]|jgi:hypothetical protein|nr:hypothetical protein [Odoribacteraceae bacterium]